MIYKVKNIKDEPFDFEGLHLDGQGVSGQLTLDVYQRLMALYYGFQLMPVEETPVEAVAPEPVDLAQLAEITEQTPETAPDSEEVTEVACDKCDKKFTSKSGMRRHQTVSHKEPTN